MRQRAPQGELKLWALFIALLALLTCGALFLSAIVKVDRDAAIHRFCMANASVGFYVQLYLDQSGRTIEWVIASTEQVHALTMRAETDLAPLTAPLDLCDHSCQHNTLGTSQEVYQSNRLQATIDRPAFYALNALTESYNLTFPLTNKC